MTERNPNGQDLSAEDFEAAFMMMSDSADDAPQLDPKAQACLKRAREFQAVIDNPETEINQHQVSITLHSLNNAWTHHGQAVDVSGWVSPDDFGHVQPSPDALDAIFGADRITDTLGAEPKHLVSGLRCETHGFTTHTEDVFRDGQFGQRAVIGLLLSRRLVAEQPAGTFVKRALPEAQVTLRAGIDAVTMDFETGSPQLAQLVSERYFPTAAHHLAELENKWSLSPTQKLISLRDHPITDIEPHYVTDKERQSLALYANSVVKIVDAHVPYYVDLADGTVLYRPDNSVMGALIGERGGQVRAIGIAVGPRQAECGPHAVTDVKGELDYRLIVNFVGDSKNGDQNFAEIRLADIVNIQSVREMAPGTILHQRGILTDITHVRRVPIA